MGKSLVSCFFDLRCRRWSLWTLAVTLLAWHSSCHTPQPVLFRATRWQLTTGSFHSLQCLKVCNKPLVRWKSFAIHKLVWWHFYRAMLSMRGTSHGPASACLCLCLCLSQVGVLLKRLQVRSHKQHHTIAHWLLVLWRQRSPRNSTRITVVPHVIKSTKSGVFYTWMPNTEYIVVWPTTSCFADWLKRRHVTLRIIDCQEGVEYL